MAQSSREIYWSAIIADFHRSGMTHVAFCRARRLPIHSFRKWLYRLRPASPSAQPPRTDRSTSSSPRLPRSAPPAFLPVHVRPEPLPLAVTSRDTRSAPRLELVLADGRRIRVPSGFDPATLHQLLDLLEQRP